MSRSKSKAAAEKKNAPDPTTVIEYTYINSPSKSASQNKAVATFVPNKYELIDIARELAKEYIGGQLYSITHDCYGTGPLRARNRLDHLANFLGDDEIDRIVQEEEQRQRVLYGDRTWHYFTEGSAVELEAFKIECAEEGKTRDMHYPGYAVDELARFAVQQLPEMSAYQRAAMLIDAAEIVKKGDVAPSQCDHDWKRVSKHDFYQVQKCTKCGALREFKPLSPEHLKQGAEIAKAWKADVADTRSA